MKVYRKIDFMNEDGSVYKEGKNKKILELPDEMAKSVFSQSMDKLKKEYEMASLSKMDICEEVERTETNMVLYIKTVLNFEYDKRITFELK